MKMEEIKKLVHDVRINVGKIRHFQFMLGAYMSKVILHPMSDAILYQLNLGHPSSRWKS